jgi:membrane associated rhomboid family serine protease
MKLTLGLIMANVAVFVWSLANPHQFAYYAFTPKALWAGRWHVIITAMFLHADVAHLVNNMVALFFLGWTLEKHISAARYVAVYVLGGILGSLAMLLPVWGLSPDILVVGASGAISALVGLGAFACPWAQVIFPVTFPLPFVLAGVIYLLATLSGLVGVPSEIAYQAHLAGLLGGALCGLVGERQRVKKLVIFMFFLILVLTLPFIMPFLIKALGLP